MSAAREEPTTLVRTQRRAGSSAEPRPFLFLVLQCQRPLDPSARLSLDGIDEVRFGRGPVRSIERRTEGGRALLDARLEDGWVSSRHARVTRDAAPDIALSGVTWVAPRTGSAARDLEREPTQRRKGVKNVANTCGSASLRP